MQRESDSRQSQFLSRELNGVDQSFYIVHRVVGREAGAGGGGDSQAFMERHGAVVGVAGEIVHSLRTPDDFQKKSGRAAIRASLH